MSNYIQPKSFNDFPTYNVCQYRGVNTYSIDNKTEETKKKNKIKSTGIIVSSSVVVGTCIGLLFLTRGANSKLYRKISNYSSELTNKINESELSGKSKNIFDSIGFAFSKGLQKVLNLFKFSANVVAVRDTAVDKFMRKGKVTGAFSEGTMKFYNKIATQEVDRCYDAVETSLRNFSATLTDITQGKIGTNSPKLDRIVSIKGIKKPLGVWLEELVTETEKINSTYEQGFSKTRRILRDKVRDAEFATLPEREWQRITRDGGLFNLRKYRNYITEELTADTSLKLRDEIQNARKLFTNNIAHEYGGMKRSLTSISDIMKMDDKDGRKILSKLFGSLEQFKKCSGVDEAVERTKIIEEMQKAIGALEKQISTSGTYSQQTSDALIKEIQFLKEISTQLGESSKGGLQRISTILNGLASCEEPIFSQKEYSQFKRSIDKLTKKMNYATNLESDDYFIKRAELKIGSAPTDIFGLVAPVGIGAYAIAKGKDKDEKIKAALTAAVPLVGGIGTYIYGTIKMFNAPKNLVFSIVTGFGLNQLGNFAVKLYKAYSEKQSFIKLATDAYKKTFNEHNETKENNQTFEDIANIGLSKKLN